MSTTNPSVKLTYEDYVCYPDDGYRHEIIDGDHYMNPAPTTYHQSVLQRLQFQLFVKVDQAKLGQVFPALTDVHLTDNDIVQPDIVLIVASRRQIITPTKVKGSPDLLVEVLSPANKKHDLELKRKLYERTGVREYWIVNPEDQTLLQLVLKDGTYQEQSHDDTVFLSVIKGVTVSLPEVWAQW